MATSQAIFPRASSIPPLDALNLLGVTTHRNAHIKTMGINSLNRLRDFLCSKHTYILDFKHQISKAKSLTISRSTQRKCHYSTIPADSPLARWTIQYIRTSFKVTQPPACVPFKIASNFACGKIVLASAILMICRRRYVLFVGCWITPELNMSHILVLYLHCVRE